MKFKTQKAARNYLITRTEMLGIDVRDINIDQLVTEVFICKGVGDNFELEFRTGQHVFPRILKALRIPRRGTVCDRCWTKTVRRLGAYMGMSYTAEDADELTVELKEQAMFAQHMMEEAL
nr:MAG TPA: protease [Caudoviricetes sp.]